MQKTPKLKKGNLKKIVKNARTLHDQNANVTISGSNPEGYRVALEQAPGCIAALLEALCMESDQLPDPPPTSGVDDILTFMEERLD